MAPIYILNFEKLPKTSLSSEQCPVSKCTPAQTISQVEERQRTAVKISILKELKSEIDLDMVYDDYNYPIPDEGTEL